MDELLTELGEHRNVARTATDHAAWLARLRKLTGQMDALIGGLGDDETEQINALAPAARAAYGLPSGVGFGFSHAVAFVALEALARRLRGGRSEVAAQIKLNAQQGTLSRLRGGRFLPGQGYLRRLFNVAVFAVELSRPLTARVASDNVASRRVLEKCGFLVVATDHGFAQARSAEIEEYVLRLA